MSPPPDNLVYIMYVYTSSKTWKEVFRTSVKMIKSYNKFCNCNLTLTPEKPEDFGESLEYYNSYRWKIEKRFESKL